MSWTQIGTTALASFMACLVECVEALTVVLAVGAVRGWRPALLGAAAALGLLLSAVAIFGRSVTHIPLAMVQFMVGTLLLLFGLSPLRKAVRRSAGIIALHDEAATYAAQSTLLETVERPVTGRWDSLGWGAAFKIVILEGMEVVFIVLAIAANGRLLWPATAGAIAALAAVLVLGVWLHRPLQSIPENALKFAVGVMVAAFGTFWVGESLHLAWPGGDAAIPVLVAGYLLCARALVAICRARSGPAKPATPNLKSKSQGIIARALRELSGLFIDDGFLAGGIVAWTVIARIGVAASPLPTWADGAVFFAGLTALLGYSAIPRRAGFRKTVGT